MFQIKITFVGKIWLHLVHTMLLKNGNFADFSQIDG